MYRNSDDSSSSEKFCRRKYLLKNMKVPTQSEVRQQLGGPLSEVRINLS